MIRINDRSNSENAGVRKELEVDRRISGLTNRNRASALIEQAGLAKTRVGGAEVSEHDANYVVVHPGATSRDVLRLIDLVRARVKERFNVELEQEITVW